MVRPINQGGIGFQDMRLFNQALLARQAWRLIQYPTSLCAQVLKAKYYPNGVLTDTIFSGSGSSTWHVIEYGLELLKKGIIWRVGNGASIRTWRDPWIPRDLQLRPISQRNRCRLKWVADFLAPDGSWDSQLLRQYFLPVDVEDILKIKTSQHHNDDFIAWHPNKRGIFSVHSAYHLSLDEHNRNHGMGSTSMHRDGSNPAWNYI
jgi:hypothetical protein